MKKAILFVGVLVHTLCFAKEGSEVLEQIRSNYSNLESFESEMNYAIYRGFESTEPVETYTGFFGRKGGDSYRRIHESEFYNFSNKGVFLQVDHRYQSMYLANAINETMFEADLEKTLKVCGNITVAHQGTQMILSLVMSKTHDLPYNRIDLKLSSDYWIESLTLFYAAKANFSKKYNQPEMDNVRMEISYSNFKKSWSDAENVLNSTNYLNLVNEHYEPAELYKNYSIVDLRK